MRSAPDQPKGAQHGDQPTEPPASASLDEAGLRSRRHRAMRSARPRHFRRRLLLIVALSVLLRGAYGLVIANDPLAGDAFNYATVAAAIADGRWFVEPFATPDTPSAEHPPATSLVLAIAPLVVGQTWKFGDLPAYVLFQRWIFALVGGATVLLVGLYGRRLAGERVGLVAAVLAACNPNLWINDGILMSESLAAFATMALLMAVDRARRRGRDQPGWLTNWVLVGALAGAGALVRSEALLIAALVIVPVWWMTSRGSLAHLARSAAAVVITTLAVVALWIGPNMVRFSEPVLFSTNDGLTLLGANCPDTYSGSLIGTWTMACTRLADSDHNGLDDWTDLQRGLPLGQPGPDPARESVAWRNAALHYIRGHLDRVPVVVATRVLRIWGLYDPAGTVVLTQGEGRRPVVSWMAWGWNLVATPLALGGLLVMRRRRQRIWPIAAQALGATLVAGAIYGLARFRVGWDVAACVPAAVALMALWTRRGRSADLDEPEAPDPAHGQTTAITG